MSIDPSLKIKGALARHRNVLTRAERIEKLKEEERWNEGDSLLGLVKVAHRKTHAGRKESEAAAAPEAAAEAAEAAPEEAEPAKPKKSSDSKA